MSNKENLQDTLNSLRDVIRTINELTRIKYKFGDDKLEVQKRLPNEHDLRDFVYHKLRDLYFNSKAITLVQYRTVKGQIFKDYKLAFRFMHKQYPNFDTLMANFVSTPITYATFTQKIVFPSVSREVVYIDIQPGKLECSSCTESTKKVVGFYDSEHDKHGCIYDCDNCKCSTKIMRDNSLVPQSMIRHSNILNGFDMNMVKQLRIEKGILTYNIAEMLHMTSAEYNKYETERLPMNGELYARIMSILKKYEEDK